MKLRNFIQEVKVAKELWSDLTVYIGIGYHRTAGEICKKIDAHKKEHPIANYIGYMIS